MTAPFLVRLSDEKVYYFENEAVVGRLSSCQVCLADESGVSRRHAKFYVSDNVIIIQDLNSTNGVLVNSEKIEGDRNLQGNDVLVFDEQEYRLELPDPIAQENTPSYAAPPAHERFDGFTTLKTPDIETLDMGQGQVDLCGIPGVTNNIVDTAADNEEPHLPDREDAQVPDGKKTDLTDNRAVAWVDSGYRNASGGTKIIESGYTLLPVKIADFAGAISQPSLLIQSGAQAGTVMELSADKEFWSIGSSQLCDLVIRDSGVSAKHAQLNRSGSKWEIADQMAANSTLVNGNRIYTVFLKHNDVICFGPISCKFGLPQANAKSVLRRSNRRWIVPALIVVILGAIGAALLSLPTLGDWLGSQW